MCTRCLTMVFVLRKPKRCKKNNVPIGKLHLEASKRTRAVDLRMARLSEMKKTKMWFFSLITCPLYPSWNSVLYKQYTQVGWNMLKYPHDFHFSNRNFLCRISTANISCVQVSRGWQLRWVCAKSDVEKSTPKREENKMTRNIYEDFFYNFFYGSIRNQKFV